MTRRITSGASNYSMGARALEIVNPSDRDWAPNRYVLAFGAYGSTLLLVWEKSLESALDEAVDWIAEHAPGLLADDAVREEFERIVAEQGLSLDDDDGRSRAEVEATVDMTCAGNAGHYIPSWEWSVTAENPSRADLLAMMGRAS